MADTILLDEKQTTSLAVFLEYAWNEELEDYDMNDGDEHHIFWHMVQLNNALYGNTDTPESIIEARDGLSTRPTANELSNRPIAR